MLEDWLMLEAYPQANACRLCHYNWIEPAYTFGLGQSYNWVSTQVDLAQVSLCRRPTGGGLVSHLNDWTYSLVIPYEHALCQAPATVSYRWVHHCLQAVFAMFGVTTQLANPVVSLQHRAEIAPSLQCFTRAEPEDLVDCYTGSKLAGAAQKRTRKGLLIQGSVHIGELPRAAFLSNFVRILEEDLQLAATFTGTPHWDASIFKKLQYTLNSESWQKKR